MIQAENLLGPPTLTCVRCDTYWPGHQVHWIAVKHARRAQPLVGRLCWASDHAIFTTEGGVECQVHNHDHGHLEAMARNGAHAEFYTGQHLLLIGGTRWMSVSCEPERACRENEPMEMTPEESDDDWAE